MRHTRSLLFAAPLLGAILASCGNGSSGLDVIPVPESALVRSVTLATPEVCGGPGYDTPSQPPFSGEVLDAGGTKLADLQQGCLYGGSFYSGKPVTEAFFQRADLVFQGIPDEGTVLTLSGTAEPGPLGCTLAAGPERHCLGGPTPGLACETDADCGVTEAVGGCEPDAHCYSTPPLRVPDGTFPDINIPICLVNAVEGEGSGSLDIATGEFQSLLPISTRVYIAECPPCVAGQCSGGDNSGGACAMIAGFASSVDCPPDGAAFLGSIDTVFFESTSEIVLSSDAEGLFCPGQVYPGAFGLEEARTIVQRGGPAGNLLDYEPHDYVAVFNTCISKSTNQAITAFGGLPFPAAVARRGHLQLERPSR